MKTKILSCLCVVFLASCSLSPGAGKTTATLKLEISRPAQQAISPLNLSLMSLIAPTTVSGFSCFAVNVMGTGIPNAGNSHEKRDPASVLHDVLAGTSYCSYPGILSPPLTMTGSSATVDLTVPVGTSRVVQAIGVSDPNNEVCGQPSLIQANSHTARFFEIARSVQDINTDMAIGLSSNYNSLSATDQAARSVDCGGPGSGSCMPQTNPTVDYPMPAPSPSVTPQSLNVNPTYAMAAQKFTTTGAIYLEGIDMVLWADGQTTITVDLMADSSGPGTYIASSYPAQILTTPGNVHFDFPPVFLVAGGSFWVKINKAYGLPTPPTYIYWATSTSTGNVPDVFNGSTWTVGQCPGACSNSLNLRIWACQ